MTSYSNVQKQQLSQLGTYLQEKRQEQEKSIEDISLQTYIRAQLLKAIESGDPSDLPQPIFVQGFIRRYADALGLDGANFAKQFPVHSIPNTPRPIPQPAIPLDMSYQTGSQKPSATQAKPAIGAMPLRSETTADSIGATEQETAEKVVATAPEQVSTPEQTSAEAVAPERVSVRKSETATLRDLTLDSAPMSDGDLANLGFNNLGDGINPDRTQPSTSATKTEELPSPAPLGAMPTEASPVPPSSYSSSSSSMGWLPWGVGAAVVVGAIALIGPRLLGGSSSQETEPPAAASQAEVVQPEPVPVEEPTPEPVPTASEAPVNLQVEITEAGPSWMSITVDGEVVFEGLLDPGTEESWEGQESITMNVGNAGAALISANGSEPVPAGNPGGAEFLTFTPDTGTASE